MGMDEWLKMYPPEDKDGGNLRPSPAPVHRKKLRKMAPQQTLDLHGMTAEEASAALEDFLRQASRKGLKKVLVIHGKGIHSDGRPVLKKTAFKVIEMSPHAGEFGTADNKDGGSGAVWVLLKQPD